MRCPFCQGLDDKVVDSRLAEDGEAIRRRRECIECSSRYTTFERVETPVFAVLKRNGVTEPFDREKLAAGLSKAFVNRPVRDDLIAGMADEIEESLLARYGVEVSSRDVGEEVMQRLAAIDEVAYLRFASVYLRFDGLTDFAREVGRLRKQSSRALTPEVMSLEETAR